MTATPPDPAAGERPTFQMDGVDVPLIKFLERNCVQ